MNHIVVIFCEGVHDVAFLSRLLKTDDYTTYHNSPIGQYPDPLNRIFEGSLKKVDFRSLKIDQLSSQSIPKKILKKEDTIVLLYAVGGNREKGKIHALMEIFRDAHSSAGFGGIKSHNLSFVFFNDADNDAGKEATTINQMLQNNLASPDFCVKHNECTKCNNIGYGLYLFSKNGQQGNLENLLIELMRKGNESIFDDAQAYYNDHYDPQRLNKKNKIYLDKSIITIAGQLQNSGASQVVTIEHSDYLTLEKIQKNLHAQEIIQFMKKVIP